MNPQRPNSIKAIALAVAWAWVALPLGWGVYQSVQKSMPLFAKQIPPAVTFAK